MEGKLAGTGRAADPAHPSRLQQNAWCRSFRAPISNIIFSLTVDAELSALCRAAGNAGGWPQTPMPVSIPLILQMQIGEPFADDKASKDSWHRCATRCVWAASASAVAWSIPIMAKTPPRTAALIDGGQILWPCRHDMGFGGTTPSGETDTSVPRRYARVAECGRAKWARI